MSQSSRLQPKSRSDQSVWENGTVGLDGVLALGGSWTSSGKNRRWGPLGVDKPLLRTFKCICSLCCWPQLGLEELLHFTAALDRTTLASEQGAGQTEGVTKVTAVRGGTGTRTRTGAPVAWESHLGRGSEWVEEEGGMERMRKKGRWRP